MKILKKMSSKWKNILRLLLLVICGAILGVNVYLANAHNLVGNQLPMPFGYGAAIVLSGSMEPALYKGDLILVKEAEDYTVNDIVVFQSGNSLVVHRIIQSDDGTVITRGDANNAPDAPIDMAEIKGKVIWKNAVIGGLVGFLKTPIGILCIIIAAIALIEIPHRKEKEKADEERRKIINEIKMLKKETED